MKKIYFVTSNKGKLVEAQKKFLEIDIRIVFFVLAVFFIILLFL